MRLAWSGLLFSVGIFLLGGCDESQPPPSQEMMMTSEPTPMCTPGFGCTCENGASGTNVCQDGKPACDCSACEKYLTPPKDPPAFTACGGEVFGTWRLVAQDTSQLAVWTNAIAPLDKRNYCSVIDYQTESLPVALWTFESGGTGWSGASSGKTAYKIDAQCARLGYRDAGPAEACMYSGAGCALGECGLCVCSSEGSSSGADLEWSVTGTQLNVKFIADNLADGTSTYSYCAEGDKLTLRGETSGVVSTYERAFVSGMPEPCPGRAPEACTGACTLSVCVGPNSCGRYTDESSCRAQQGCNWDPDACLGVAQCRYQDYGVEPGCIISTEPPADAP
jgi:hypothetical protein